MTILALGIMMGCSSEQQTADSSQSGNINSQTNTSQSGSAIASEMPDLNLVFFLDPNGGPCIMQNNILVDMADELTGKVQIRYVQTTVPEHRNLFSHYGIRALPTILLADSEGKEIKRMPPGVKKADAILALIQTANTQ
ncbi:MAG: hypothetical protein KAH09_04025 [Desulfobacula sp.]|nr:hypothetical protein [Desulfobacula sp.]